MENTGEFQIPEDALQRMQDPEVIKEYISEGKTFQEIIGYPDGTMEKFYGAARKLFEKGRYRDAADAFIFLTTLNPYVHNYWLGLGMSEQMSEEYESAVVAYTMASVTDPQNPIAHLHAATCNYMLQDDEGALGSADMAIAESGNRPEYQEIRSQAMRLRDTLRERLKGA